MSDATRNEETGRVPLLPLEIIRHILEVALPVGRLGSLRRQPRYSTLLPLLVVNSTWSAIALGLLYSHLVFDGADHLNRFCASQCPAAARQATSARLGEQLDPPPRWDRYLDQKRPHIGLEALQALSKLCPGLKDLFNHGDFDLSPLLSLNTLHLEETSYRGIIPGVRYPVLRRLSVLSPLNNDLRTLFQSPTDYPFLWELVLAHYYEDHPLYTQLALPLLPTQITSLALLIAPPDDGRELDTGASQTNLLSLFTSLEHLVLGGNGSITSSHFRDCIDHLTTSSLHSLVLEADFAQDSDVLHSIRTSPALESLCRVRISYPLTTEVDPRDARTRSSIEDECAKRGIVLELRCLSSEDLEERTRWDWYTQEFESI